MNSKFNVYSTYCKNLAKTLIHNANFPIEISLETRCELKLLIKLPTMVFPESLTISHLHSYYN